MGNVSEAQLSKFENAASTSYHHHKNCLCLWLSHLLDIQDVPKVSIDIIYKSLQIPEDGIYNILENKIRKQKKTSFRPRNRLRKNATANKKRMKTRPRPRKRQKKREKIFFSWSVSWRVFFLFFIFLFFFINSQI